MKKRMIEIAKELDKFNDDISISMFRHTYGYEINLTIEYCYKRTFGKLNNQIEDFIAKYINEDEVSEDSMSRYRFSIFGAEYYRYIRIMVKDKE